MSNAEKQSCSPWAALDAQCLSLIPNAVLEDFRPPYPGFYPWHTHGPINLMVSY